MSDDEERVQEVVEAVDDDLQKALEHAETYNEHDDVRPSALMAFDKIDSARQKLDEIDNRDFNDEPDQ